MKIEIPFWILRAAIRDWWGRKHSEPLYCPRRVAPCGYENCTVHHACIESRKGSDYWYRRDGVLVCSYCGGLKPEQVALLLKEGKVEDFESTDKYYKFYLHVPSMKPGTFKFYMPHFKREEWEAVVGIAKERGVLNAWRKRFVPQGGAVGAMPGKGV